MTDHANELRIYAGKIGRNNIHTKTVMRDAAAYIEYLEHRLREAEARVAELEADRAELEKQGPVFWYRPCCDGEMYEGPIHNDSITGKWRREERPGEWVPLYAGSAPEASRNTYTMPDGVGVAKWTGLQSQGFRAIGFVFQNFAGRTGSLTEHGRVVWEQGLAHPCQSHAQQQEADLADWIEQKEKALHEKFVASLSIQPARGGA